MGGGPVNRDRSHPVFVSQHFAALKAAVAAVAEPPRRAPTLPVKPLSAPSKAETAESTVPMRSGPCLVKWQSHDWSGPRGTCSRCGQVRG